MCIKNRYVFGILWLFCICLIMWGAAISNAQEEFDCSMVTDVSQHECEILVLLYNNTNGAMWHDSTNWLVTPNVCEWHGISCGSLLGLIRPSACSYGGGCGLHIEKIDLSSQGLDGTLPIEIGGLDYIMILDISDNSALIDRVPITVIDISLPRFARELFSFDFSGTQLCEPPDASYQLWKAQRYEYNGTNIICESETMFAKVYVPILIE